MRKVLFVQSDDAVARVVLDPERELLLRRRGSSQKRIDLLAIDQ
jgi:hypothetical protein